MKKVYVALHAILMFYAISGIFSKKAAQEPFLSVPYIKYYMLVLAILIVYAFVWQQLLMRLPLTVAMANKAVTVIWGMVYGVFFFQEKITFFNLLGAALIIAGICIVAGEDGMVKEEDRDVQEKEGEQICT